MATSTTVYRQALVALLSRDATSDTLKVLLCTSAYKPDALTQQYRSDLTGEVDGTGYTAGGQALTGITITPGITASVVLDCDDVTWPGSTLTARYAVFYDATRDAAGKQPLLLCWDFGADQSSATGPFTLKIADSGLLTLRT